MGYYTDYELTTSSSLPPNFLDVFLNTTGYSLYDFTLSGKWYNFKEDMLEISKLYPDIVFQLDGVGEESGDVWRIYFKNGKHQNANTQVTVTHDGFDELKLV